MVYALTSVPRLTASARASTRSDGSSAPGGRSPAPISAVSAMASWRCSGSREPVHQPSSNRASCVSLIR
nr:hypothetical protein [Gandjariella thermophila]